MPIMRVAAGIWLSCLLISHLYSQVQLSAEQSQIQEPAIAEGQVISAATGQPLAHASVTIRLSNPENAAGGFSMETDDGGSFHFEKLDPGRYDITVTKTGYLGVAFGAKRINGPGIPVLLEAGKTASKLDVKMYSEATVTGTLTDEDGEPVRADIELMKRGWISGKVGLRPAQRAYSDSHGRYTLSGVGPGKYLLRTTIRDAIAGTHTVEVDRQGNPLNAHLVSTFYGDTTNADSATLLRIQPGQEVTDANIQILRERTFHIKGRVVSSSPNESPMNYLPFLMASDGSSFSGFSAQPKKNGQFEIDNVQPGSYLVMISQQGPGGGSFSVPVEVSNDNIDNLEITVPPPFDVQGKITIENRPAVDLSGIEIMLLANSVGGAQAVVASDGTFTLRDVFAGHFQLIVRTPGQTTFVKTIQLGGRNLPDKSIDLTQASPGPLEIVLSASPTQVEGLVMKVDPDSQITLPASAINVVLIPEKRTEDRFAGIRWASTDARGYFTIRGIEPGNYKAFAADGIDTQQWNDPDLAAELDAQAVAIDLREGDTEQVQLKLITGTEAAQVLDRLGL